MSCDSCRKCRVCNIEKYPFEVDGHNFTGSELISKAERKYGCQADTNLKWTSRAAKCLEENGHTVRDRREV